MRRPSTQLLLLLAVAAAGCSSSETFTPLEIGAVQQLVTSEASARAVAQLRWPDVEKKSVVIKIGAQVLPQRTGHLEQAIAVELAKRGARLVSKPAEADLVAIVVADSIGSLHKERLVGLPSTQSALFPIATPELAIFKSVDEQGFAKTRVVIANARDGGVISQSGPSHGRSYWSRYRILFVPFERTDTTWGVGTLSPYSFYAAKGDKGDNVPTPPTPLKGEE